MSNIADMPLGAAGASSRTTETSETETVTEETTTTTTTRSGTETVNVTVTKLRTRTTKVTETTSQQPALPPSAHVHNYSPALSLVSGQNRASDSSPVPSVRDRAAAPPSAKSSELTPGKSRVPANDIKIPTTPVNEFYVVIIGQEPGIFYNWNDAAARVLGVSKNIHFKCTTFQDALQRYKSAYYSNEVKCVPNPGMRFLTQGTLDAPRSSRSTPCEESASDVEYWRDMVDLSEEMSNVCVA
ncbi:hypothetical protein BKA83DRAFT_4546725 [Pisolithus microcarpus]|nr:hypothetical protein BKA83DRAFT_4546725 [Pisolithus microcarpus]